MLTLKELNLGFADSANYLKRHNKELFNRFFVQNTQLAQLLQPDRYFVIGEKGTGKTAFSVFLSNNAYKNHKSSTAALSETDYQAFVHLKKQHHLDLSGYDSVWRAILLVLMCDRISEGELDLGFLERSRRLKVIKKAIAAYHETAFSPEVVSALTMAKDSTRSAKVVADFMEAEFGEKNTQTFEQKKYQANIKYLNAQLTAALEKLKIKESKILFIDGIDIRPSGISYPEYLDCIRGLANAAWYLNHKLFPSFRDSPGRLKIVLLLRPDIYNALNLQNQNAKIRDNSVYIDWLTTYPYYRGSEIFEVCDRLLSVQQDSILEKGAAWDYYFPFKNEGDDSFVSFLRFSFFRPRDLLQMMSLIRDRAVRSRGPDVKCVSEEDFNNSEFRRDYSNYLLGEVKDQLQFYFAENDYEAFLRFFEYLEGKLKFNYQEYVLAFHAFSKSFRNKLPFIDNKDDFLQFLYELGILCYTEIQDGKKMFRWCFRERSYANMKPQVSINAESFEIHYGLSKALNTGRKILKR